MYSVKLSGVESGVGVSWSLGFDPESESHNKSESESDFGMGVRVGVQVFRAGESRVLNFLTPESKSEFHKK